MLKTPNSFKNKMKKYGKQLNILLKFGKTTIDKTYIKSVEPSINGEMFTSIMRQMVLEIEKYSVETEESLLTADVQLGVRISEFEDYEYIDYGEYVVYDKEDVVDKNSMKLYLFDHMIDTHIKYDDDPLQLDYKSERITVLILLQAICDKFGFILKTTDFVNANKVISEDKYAGIDYTYRDILDEISAVAGGFIKIFNKDLYVAYPEETEEVIDENDLEKLTIGKKIGPFNSLVLGRSPQEDNIYYPSNMKAEDRISMRIDNNQIMDKNREDFIINIFNKINGLEYYVFEFTSFGFGYFEFGDIVTLKNLKGENFKTILFNVIENIDSGIKGKSYTEETNYSETKYEYATGIEKKLRNTEIICDKQEGRITQLVEETTENSEKLSKHEQTIDSMKDTISSVETKVETVEKTANSASEKADSAEATANSAKQSADNAVTQVETTTERLVEVEKNLDGITSTVSETVKKVETVEGKADSAQQTADTANKNAQNAQKSIETTNERVSKAEQTLDGFSQTVSSVQETLETTNAKFDNLEIGGTNLVSNLEINWEQGTLGENAPTGSTYDQIKSTASSSTYHTKRIRIKELIPIDSQFVISFNNSNYSCCFALFDSSKKYLGITTGFYSWFDKSPSIFSRNASYIALVLKKQDDSAITPSEISKVKIKLENGNKATDWSESPEDINQKFSNYSTTTEMNSAITQKANEITSKVSETYSTKTETTQAKNDAISSANSSTDNKLKNYTNTTGMNSAIDKAKKEAEGNANNYTDGKLVNYSTTTQMNSAIKQSADSITSSVEKTITEKIDNIQVGGTNLVSNLPINWEQGSFTESSNAGSTYAQMKTTVGSSIHHVNRIRIKELIPIDSQFVISFDASNYMCCFCLFDGNKQYMGVNTGFYSWFNGVPGIFNKNASYIALALKKKDDSVVTPSEISKVKIKLENGNKATDWTPAPEDTESKFENYYTKTETNSQIDQKSNQITSTVQQNITTAIDGIVIGGENLVSSLEANWEQGTLGEGANTGVTYDSVKTSNGSTTRIRTKDIIPIDSKFIVSFASGYRCCFCLFDANKKYLGQSAGFVNWFTTSPNMFDKNAKYIALCFSKDDGTSAISIKDVKNMKIKLELGTKSSGWSVAPEDYYTKSEIDQKDNQISLDVTGKVSDLEKTLNAKIDLKVDTKKLISEINASADQITLNSNRLIINSSYFTLDKNGKITATSGQIGGFSLSSNQLYSRINGLYDYDEYDLAKAVAHYFYETIDLSYDIQRTIDYDDSYDINMGDIRKIGQVINGEIYNEKEITGQFVINAQDPKHCISVYGPSGTVVASIGLGGIDSNIVTTNNFICGKSYPYSSGSWSNFDGTIISYKGINTNNISIGRSYASYSVIENGDTGILLGRSSGTTNLRGSTVRLYSTGGGGVYLGSSGSTAVTSDETQKYIYEIDDKYINFFNKLKPITYIYKNKGHRNHIGFGARQVENALLESGLTTEQFAGILIDEDITISAEEMRTEENVHFDKLYSLRYEEFIALNTMVIQNQMKEIEELKKRIDILESMQVEEEENIDGRVNIERE